MGPMLLEIEIELNLNFTEIFQHKSFQKNFHDHDPLRFLSELKLFTSLILVFDKLDS